MWQYSHVCLRCGYAAINNTAAYMQCPGCGGTQKNIHTRLPDSKYQVPLNYLYVHKCCECGWTTPPTNIGGTGCPVYNKMMVRTERVYFDSPGSASSASNSFSSESYSLNSSNNNEYRWILGFILAFAAISFLAFWLLMPTNKNLDILIEKGVLSIQDGVINNNNMSSNMIHLIVFKPELMSNSDKLRKL